MPRASPAEHCALRVPLGPLVQGTMTLPPDAAIYLLRVHRLKRGDRFVAFDPETATEANAELVDPDRSSPLARIGEIRLATLRPRRRVTLIQATAKGDKLDAIVRDATELGVTCIVPAIAERSVSRPSGDTARTDRFRRIAVQAARQCGRGDAPRIEPPLLFIEAIERFASYLPASMSPASSGQGAALEPMQGARVALCLDPRAGVPVRSRLLGLPPNVEVVLVVGPEGGLSAAELALCERAGIHCVSMGNLVLRTETVCAAVLGALLVLSAPLPSDEGSMK